VRLGRKVESVSASENQYVKSNQIIRYVAQLAEISLFGDSDAVEPAEDIAVRLTIDTEVIVAPKTRYGPKTNVTTEKHNIGGEPSSSQVPKLLAPEVQKATRQLLRLLPSDFPILQGSNGQNQERFAYVDYYQYSLLLQAFPSTRVALRVKSCPSLTDNQAHPSGENAPGSDKGKGKDLSGNDETSTESLCYLMPSSSVPSGAVWISAPARRDLDIGQAAFELLQILAIVRESDSIGNTIRSNELNTVQMSEESVVKSDANEGTPVLAGFDKHIDKSLNYIKEALVNSQVCRQPTSHILGLLVCGGSGSGKTSLVERIAQDCQLLPSIMARAQYVKCAQLVNLRIPQLRLRLEEEFTAAAWHAPSLLILDDLDHLIPAEVEHIDSFRSLHIANLFTYIAKKASEHGGIVVLATSKASETLHAQLAQSHFFSERINLLAPDKAARKDILSTLAKSRIATSNDLVFADDFNFASIAAQTDGYLPVDLRDLIDRALHQAAIRAGKHGRITLDLSLADTRAAQADFTPLSLRDVKLQKSEVEWSDIGGLQETRRVLRETLEWPTKYSAIFASSPLRLRSG
jgi:peroxin-1